MYRAVIGMILSITLACPHLVSGSEKEQWGKIVRALPDYFTASARFELDTAEQTLPLTFKEDGGAIVVAGKYIITVFHVAMPQVEEVAASLRRRGIELVDLRPQGNSWTWTISFGKGLFIAGGEEVISWVYGEIVHDYAVLELKVPVPRAYVLPVELNTGDPARYTGHVVMPGSLAGRELQVAARPGAIDLSFLTQFDRYLVTHIPVSGGDSGYPLFLKGERGDYECVGIAKGKSEKGDLSWFLRLSNILEEVKSQTGLDLKKMHSEYLREPH